MRKVIAALFVLTSVAILLACSNDPNDEKISKNIQTRISADPLMRGSQVYVESKQGKVTLKGRAKDQVAQLQAEKIAREEPGVSAVHNQTVLAREVAVTPPPPPPQPIVVPSGTVLTIRTDQPLGSKTSQAGTVFSGIVWTPITVEGKMVIAARSPVTGVVKHAKKAGRFKGAAALTLVLDSVTVNGHQYNIETEELALTSTGKGKRTAGAVVGGSGAGAAIGGIAAGGAGAAVGAVAGAGAGVIGAASGKRDINVPAEAALMFRLVQPLTLRPES